MIIKEDLQNEQKEKEGFMKKAAAYIRVSTEDQTEYSPDAQLVELKKYAASHDMIIEEQFIFMDEGISGRNTKKREGFQRMIGIAKGKPKPFEVILVWKFSRFARNREDSIVYKSMLRKQCDIDVISITESLGDDKMSVLIEALIEAMDEYYSINLAEEVKRGMTEKARRGEFQTTPPMGYTKEPGKPLQIEQDEAAHVKYIFDQYLAGTSIYAIAQKLNAMGVKTKKRNKIENRQVEYILNNPMYKGYVRWTPEGKTVSKRIYDSPDTLTVRSKHPPIIDEAVWDIANKKYWSEKKKMKKYDKPSDMKRHWLSGILKCAECGKTMAYSNANKSFQCIGYTHGTCPVSHNISASKISSAITNQLRAMSLTKEYLNNINVTVVDSGEKDMMKKELSSARTMLERAKQSYLAGFDTLEEYGANKSNIQKRINELENLIAQIPEVYLDQDLLKKRISDILLVIDSDISEADKNAAVHSVIEKIEFSRPTENFSIYFYH